MDALILSCGMGGGHDAAACAIREELLRRGDNAVVLNPYILHSDALAKRINRTYIKMAQRMPSCFGAIYKLGDAYRRLPWRSPVYYLNGRMIPIMEDYLNKNHYDVVIMTHLFPAEIMTQMKAHGIEIPKTVFIATDYTCIPFTEETDCDAYIIPAEELRTEFNKRGIPSERIFPLGIPVSDSFKNQISKEKAREMLGLKADKKYLLVSGGSIGAGRLARTVRLLYGQCDETMRLIVICGNNERLYQSLVEKYGDAMDIIKSTDQMAVYMSASDLYFVKPGGLSSTEAAVMGIPLIHLSPIPGCETKNADFFYTNGMNYKITATKQNIEQAVSLITDTAKCTEMITNQNEIISKNSAANICEFAQNMKKKVV